MTTSSPHLPDQPRASWLAPIALGALTTIAFCIGLPLLATLVPGAAGGCVFCCALPLAPALLGYVPVAVALRRDPALSVGQGFALAFIAVGLGAVVAAIAGVAAVQAIDPSEIRDFVDRTVEQMPAEERSNFPPERVAEVKDVAVDALPYVPVMLAALLTLCAGLAGLVLTAVLRRAPVPPPNG